MIIKCIHTWNWVWISLKLKNKIISRFFMNLHAIPDVPVTLNCALLDAQQTWKTPKNVQNMKQRAAWHHRSNKRSRKERKRSENLIWKYIKFPVNKTAIISILISTVVPCPLAVFTVYFSWIAPLYVGALSSSRVRTERVLKWVWNKLIK